MSDTQFQGFPNPQVPVQDRNGLTLPWFRFFTAIWQRLGAGGAGDAVFSAGSLDPATEQGFVFIPGGDGPPTGTPLTYNGQTALYADYTGKKVYAFFYGDSAWTALN